MKITTDFSVEIEDSKRFNAQGVEVFKPSKATRMADNGKVYHQYVGTLVEAEAPDLTPAGIGPLAERVKADLYDDSDLPPLEALADVLNNGGLRLAYGDYIKRSNKTGQGSRGIETQALKWLVDAAPTDVLIEFKSRPDGKERQEWLVQQFIDSRK